MKSWRFRVQWSWLTRAEHGFPMARSTVLPLDHDVEDSFFSTHRTQRMHRNGRKERVRITCIGDRIANDVKLANATPAFILAFRPLTTSATFVAYLLAYFSCVRCVCYHFFTCAAELHTLREMETQL